MFKHAIVRTPCPEMIHGITSASLGKPDYTLALDQHKQYIDALRSLGLKINILEPDSRFPDSTFVEDVALCTAGFSVITNPGAAPLPTSVFASSSRLDQRMYPDISGMRSPWR